MALLRDIVDGMRGTSAHDEMLDAVFGALANAPRRRVLRLLRSEPVATPTIATRFNFSKQALSRHLRVLEDAGLIARSADGRVNYVAMVPEGFQDVSNWIFELGRGWHASLERLDSILRGPQ